MSGGGGGYVGERLQEQAMLHPSLKEEQGLTRWTVWGGVGEHEEGSSRQVP